MTAVVALLLIAALSLGAWQAWRHGGGPLRRRARRRRAVAARLRADVLPRAGLGPGAAVYVGLDCSTAVAVDAAAGRVVVLGRDPREDRWHALALDGGRVRGVAVLVTPATGAPRAGRCRVVLRVTVDAAAAPRHDVVVYDRGVVPGAAPPSPGRWRATLAEAEHWRARVAAVRGGGEGCRACGRAVPADCRSCRTCGAPSAGAVAAPATAGPAPRPPPRERPGRSADRHLPDLPGR